MLLVALLPVLRVFRARGEGTRKIAVAPRSQRRRAYALVAASTSEAIDRSVDVVASFRRTFEHLADFDERRDAFECALHAAVARLQADARQGLCLGGDQWCLVAGGGACPHFCVYYLLHDARVRLVAASERRAA